MLSKLRLCRRAFDLTNAKRNVGVACRCMKRRTTRGCLLMATQVRRFQAFTEETGKMYYSTTSQSRFSKCVDGEEERQYTATFATAAAAVSSASTFPPSQAPLSPYDVASGTSQDSTARQPELAMKDSTAPGSSSARDQQEGAGSSAEGSNSELATLFESLLDSAQAPSSVQQAHACINNAGKATTASKLAAERVSESALPTPTPTPLELLPPRPTQAPRVSLFSRFRTDFGTTDEGPFDASLPAETTQPPGVYSALFRESFVNPFNGRLIRTNSSSATRLFRLGFYRSRTNPLHLEWSPTEYVTALQKVLAEQQKRFENRKKRLQRQQRREQRAARASASLLKTTKGETEALVSNAHPTSETSASVDVPMTDAQNAKQSNKVESTVSCEPLLPAEAVAEARAQLLRPLRRLGADHWMSTVANIMERQDVFTFLNKEMERLYANLCTALVPPKLDTPVDAAVADIELTRDQKHVMQLALSGFNIFVGGSAGTGKTVLLKSIFRELTRLGLRVAMTATTGVAAVQLGGCTFHHAFNAPVDATPQRWDASALRAVDVVIIDEVSLLDASMFDAFDMEARLARMRHVPFGGLQVIICGDFLQLSREDTMPAYESAAFKYLVAVRLVTPMRHSAGAPLLKLLDELRRGEFNTEQFQALDRPIPASTTQITYIFPRRREAQQLNEAKLGELESREMTFTPQRGPLQLWGTFTPSALIEVARDANGMQKPLPRREQVLDAIHTEAQRILGNEGGGTGPLPRVADHELVLMLVRSEGTTSNTRFILRLRCRDSNETATAPTATTGAGAPDMHEEFSNPLTAAALRAFTPMVKPSKANSMLPRAPHRAQRVLSPFSESAWEQIAAAVATRLGGRLITMLSPEPPSMVPLSVSMTLADMTSPDIAHSLSPLRLKLGCRVMVNRNLSRTVSNGSVGIVEAFAPPDAALFPCSTDRVRSNAFKRLAEGKLFEQLPVVRLLSGEVVQVPPVSLLVGGTAQSYYYGHDVLTIPLQLGYAFTVHKVQGLTLQGTVVLDCEKFFDCPHLIYVACSRVRQLDQLIVRHVEPRMIIVRRSALEFSDHLQEAFALNTHTLPPTCVRGTWTQQTAQRILAISE